MSAGWEKKDPWNCITFFCYIIIPIIILIGLAVIFRIWEIIITLGLITLIGGSIFIYYKYNQYTKVVEVKKDHMDLTWLKHQYYDLGRSLQDIANDQDVSMITIRKWVDKLEVDSKELGANE